MPTLKETSQIKKPKFPPVGATKKKKKKRKQTKPTVCGKKEIKKYWS